MFLSCVLNVLNVSFVSYVPNVMWCDVSYMSNAISVLFCHLFPMCCTYSLCPMLCACFLCHMCQMWCTCYLCHMCSMCCTFPICHKCSMLFACFLYQMCLMCHTCPLCHMCPTWCAYFLCLDLTSFYGWISSSRTGWAFRTLSGGKGWVVERVDEPSFNFVDFRAYFGHFPL